MAMPRRSLRQFECKRCPHRERGDPRYRRIWWAAVPDSDPYSECRCLGDGDLGGCGEKVKAIEVGQELGVCVGTFDCPCGRKYTGLCERTDTSPCYECNKDNFPSVLKPPRWIKKKTSNKHNCKKCGGCKDCPNLQALRGVFKKPKLNV